MADIYVNGKFVGTVENAREFAQSVVEERRKGAVDVNLNVHYDLENDEVYLETCKGRARRPVIVVRNGVPLLTENHLKALDKGEMSWTDLLKQGVVEYLDAAEEENALIAFTPAELTKEHTHLEISPLDILGLCASLVPFGDFNQSTRLNAGAKNQKQAIGFYATNFAVRMDMDVNLLQSPQIPIVQTIMHDIAGYDRHPAGQNMVVAILSYRGYNMEDAVILNKGSIDRGLARSFYFRPASSEELRYTGGLTDEIGTPDKEIKGYRTETEYRFLEDDGIIYPEAKVKEGDVIIGKTSPPRFLSSMDEFNLAANTRRESSFSLAHGEEGTVDFVCLTENSEGNKLVYVRLRDERIPEIGDKFTSRHGQKGVVGLIVPQADMPFSSTGIVPDLLFSPHGIPSRMTISHLFELVAGKTGSLAGRYIDGTTFAGEPLDNIRKQLLALGFREDGTEAFCDGTTGKMFEAKIYVGNMYYLKLKHMVANKLHSRARGPIQLLTRQPTEGRAKEGGLRLGEMEKDTFVAHGASLLIKERFDSDSIVVPICSDTGMVAVKNELTGKSYCPVGGEGVDISNVEMSYAFKLMIDEFRALGVDIRLNLEDKY